MKRGGKSKNKKKKSETEKNKNGLILKMKIRKRKKKISKYIKKENFNSDVNYFLEGIKNQKVKVLDTNWIEWKMKNIEGEKWRENGEF